jgi:hypothetical protein
MLQGVPSKRDLRSTADSLRRILEAVERGELDAPPGLAQRIEGAARSLEALGDPANARALDREEK